jgi:hypothetical protein
MAIADLQIAAPPPERLQACLAAARQALRADYPWDEFTFEHENNHCLSFEPDRDGAVSLDCAGDCDGRSCHSDACDGWSSYVDVTLQNKPGADTQWRGPDYVKGGRGMGKSDRQWSWRRVVGGVLARVEVSTLREGADDPRLRARVLRQAQRARRALDACLTAR